MPPNYLVGLDKEDKQVYKENNVTLNEWWVMNVTFATRICAPTYLSSQLNVDLAPPVLWPTPSR